ncbi:hypothetical protein CHUAL_005369 [Chamberlinius hualienensis]
MLIEIPNHLQRCKYATQPQTLPTATGTAAAAQAVEQSTSLTDVLTDNVLNELVENGKLPLSVQQNKTQTSRVYPKTTLGIQSPSRGVINKNEFELEKQRLQKDLKLPESVSSKFSKMDIQNKDSVAKLSSQRFRAIPGKEYNIILMGQTGVGKSTFINAFANYLTFNNLNEAVVKELHALIACHFSISDDSYRQQSVHFGHDNNENLEGKGESATQSCKAYEFPIDNFTLRIIDTPGIGDTRGIDQDYCNLNGILKFLSKYKELYAVCILLKPNEAKLTSLFAFCIQQLLSRLHENASNNIVFIFTNSRNTFYRPGDTLIPLQTLLDKIRNAEPHPDIPFSKNNIFCLDNEAFRFLVALKNGIRFSEEDRKDFSQSWNKSVNESERLIRYIVEGSDGHGLTPHNVGDSLSVNEAREAILDLAKPIANIAKIIQDNLQVLGRHKKDIENCEGDVGKLKSKLYMPIVTLDIRELDQPRTVCTGENCREPHQMNGTVTYHYPKKCHDPCYLDEVPRDTVGHETLRHCHAIDFNSANCRHCGCHFSQHMHIYYESEVVQKNAVDENIQSQLKTKAGIKQAAENMVARLEAEIVKYEKEEKKLTELSAKLAVFLKNSAMVVRTDAIQEYLNELIENEKSLGHCAGANNAQMIKRLEQMLREYEVEKEILEKAMKNNIKEVITPTDVYNIIAEISSMNITGCIIKDSVTAQSNVKRRGGGGGKFQTKVNNFFDKLFSA